MIGNIRNYCRGNQASKYEVESTGEYSDDGRRLGGRDRC